MDVRVEFACFGKWFAERNAARCFAAAQWYHLHLKGVAWAMRRRRWRPLCRYVLREAFEKAYGVGAAERGSPAGKSASGLSDYARLRSKCAGAMHAHRACAGAEHVSTALSTTRRALHS